MTGLASTLAAQHWAAVAEEENVSTSRPLTATQVSMLKAAAVVLRGHVLGHDLAEQMDEFAEEHGPGCTSQLDLGPILVAGGWLGEIPQVRRPGGYVAGAFNSPLIFRCTKKAGHDTASPHDGRAGHEVVLSRPSARGGYTGTVRLSW